ncbi:MAG: UbiD family decarboxylase [Thermodesulfobacteriota bacterium]
MPEFPFTSLRDWIAFLKAQGQLVENKEEVDLQGEVAAVSRKIALTDGPAVIHNNIKGYPGWRIFTDGLTTRQRAAWALGLPEQGLGLNLAERQARLEKKKPVVLKDGPCKELKFFGDEVDLVKLPIPFTGEYDVPPFLTAGISNIKDPDTGWQNTGIRRFQLQGKNRLGNLVLPFQHEGIIFAKYIRQNRPAPVAIVLGADPLYCLAGMMPAPDQVDEMDTWGAFAGRPLEVVPAETSDLLVPAAAEIVIEGEMDPRERILEGPFSEFTGFYSGLRYLPSIQVKCVTMRKDPIFQSMYMAVPTSEAHNTGHLMTEVALLSQIRELVPEVKDVAVLSSWGMVASVALDKKARAKKPGLARKVAVTIKAVKASPFVKNVILVDDDIDCHNVHEVLWCLAVKFQGEKDILTIPDFTGVFLDPSEPWLGKGPGLTTYTVLDCTEKPPPYDEAYKRGVAQPQERYRLMVEDKWTQYGF